MPERLPWRPLSELLENDGGPVLVCSGGTPLFARRCWSWSLNDEIDTSQPLWTSIEDTMALDPQPEHYLPIILPNGVLWGPA